MSPVRSSVYKLYDVMNGRGVLCVRAMNIFTREEAFMWSRGTFGKMYF